MFSILKPSLLYTDISPDIIEHDEDHDAEEWSYADKMVFRGSLDTSYKKHGLDVFWLYNDDLSRIGLAEHEIDDHSVFRTLWFYDNPYGTLLQEDGWKSNGTLWSYMTEEAYQDCLQDDTLLLKAANRIVKPEYLISGFPDLYQCSCGTFFSPRTGCTSVKKKVTVVSPFFIDNSCIVYVPPTNSTVWSKLGLEQRRDACDLQQVEPLTEKSPEQEPQTEQSLA